MLKEYARYSAMCFVLILFGTFQVALAQEDKEVDEKKDARISLAYTNTNNNSPTLTVTIKSRENRVYVGVKDVKVNFYYHEISDEGRLGFSTTNENGESIYEISNDFYLSLDSTNYFSFFATIDDDPIINDNEAEVAITRSKIDLSLEEIDSVKTIKLSISAPDENDELIPAEGIEASIYVKRLFGLLPIAEYEESDEDGIITVELPDDIPGDTDGNILIYAKVDDDSDYGTLIATRQIDWGIPAEIAAVDQPRELWSPGSNAPLYLVFIVNFLVICIWGVIFYLIYQVFRIKKLGVN